MVCGAQAKCYLSAEKWIWSYERNVQLALSNVSWRELAISGPKSLPRIVPRLLITSTYLKIMNKIMNEMSSVCWKQMTGEVQSHIPNGHTSILNSLGATVHFKMMIGVDLSLAPLIFLVGLFSLLRSTVKNFVQPLISTYKSHFQGPQGKKSGFSRISSHPLPT